MPAYIHSDRGTSFMSQELKEYLFSNGIATSRTTPYNPQGNGQVERYNGILWKTVELALKNRNLDITKWETVLDEALHAVRSLLCTTINCTPHERMFSHPRRSSNGISTPTWLMNPGPVLMKNHARHSKYDPLVEDVTLIHGNSDYAYVRFPDGRETTISTRHLAPAPEPPSGNLSRDMPREHSQEWGEESIIHKECSPHQSIPRVAPTPLLNPTDSENRKPAANHQAPSFDTESRNSAGNHQVPAFVRQSSRTRRAPRYLSDYVQN